MIAETAPRGVIAVQALLEFLAIVRRRRPDRLHSAIAKVEAWTMVFEAAPTTARVASDAAELMRAHHLQVWDAVIWSAARAVGAQLFLSEDLQDGLSLSGVRAINPFTRDLEALRSLLNATGS